MIYLVPIRYLRHKGRRLPLRFVGYADKEMQAIAIVGRPLWKTVPKRLGMSVEDFIPIFLEHESLHLVLPAGADKGFDKKWPWSVPR